MISCNLNLITGKKLCQKFNGCAGYGGAGCPLYPTPGALVWHGATGGTD